MSETQVPGCISARNVQSEASKCDERREQWVEAKDQCLEERARLTVFSLYAKLTSCRLLSCMKHKGDISENSVLDAASSGHERNCSSSSSAVVVAYKKIKKINKKPSERLSVPFSPWGRNVAAPPSWWPPVCSQWKPVDLLSPGLFHSDSFSFIVCFGHFVDFFLGVTLNSLSFLLWFFNVIAVCLYQVNWLIMDSLSVASCSFEYFLRIAFLQSTYLLSNLFSSFI